MVRSNVSLVFESLTPKQHEALELAAAHLTSKQIAIALGVSPVTIDKRIDAVRIRLDQIPRSDLVRLYLEWHKARNAAYDPFVGDPVILVSHTSDLPTSKSQLADKSLVFEDSITFDARASWESDPAWLRPGLKPSDLGLGGKVAVILGGAIAILMIAVLLMASINALVSFLGG